MTVSYSNKVATSSFSCFLKLLLRWRGSIYKLLWKDFVVFATLYYTLSFLYRFALPPRWRLMFERISLYCHEFNSLIPVAFVLGFYVSIVVNRWWEQFKTIPYPSRMAMFVSALVTGNDERGRLMRRTIMRYLCLSYVMTMSSISPAVKKRFPTLEHMTEAGFMLPNEQKVIEDMTTTYNKYFVPLVWAASLVSRARKEGRIKDDFAVKTLIDEINEFRGKCGTLFGFDWVTIPLVYTQVVTLAVYMFFLSCLMGRQFLENGHIGDMYFPFFTFLQFFFYMGWLKVAETLLNPFGEDDDDFDVNGLIDKNLQISYLVVDEMHEEHPELIKDQYWDSLEFELPYTEAAQRYQKEEHIGSAANIEIPEAKAQFLGPASSMSTITEEKGGRGVDGNIGSMRSSDEDMAAAALGKSPSMLSKRDSKRLKQSISTVARSTSKLSIWRAGSRRPSKKKVDDVEVGSLPLSSLKSSDPLSRKMPGSPDELMFPISDDEASPVEPLSPAIMSVVSETSPFVPKLKPGQSYGSAPTDSHLTEPSHLKYHTQTSHLEPLVEAAETTDAFLGEVRNELQKIREGLAEQKV